MDSKIAVIGCHGFVGSAICRYLESNDKSYYGVNRSNFNELCSDNYDIIINSAMPSKRYWAKNNPLDDFQATVGLTADIFYNWNYDKIIQISSVSARCQLDQPYGINKRCAEELVLKNKKNLVLRLGAIYGKGLEKGALFDILNGNPVYVDGKSKYNFLDVDLAAQYIYELRKSSGIIEVGAKDEISLNEIAETFKKEVSFSGSIEFQNTISPDPSYPSSFEVISFLERHK